MNTQNKKRLLKKIRYIKDIECFYGVITPSEENYLVKSFTVFPPDINKPLRALSPYVQKKLDTGIQAPGVFYFRTRDKALLKLLDAYGQRQSHEHTKP